MSVLFELVGAFVLDLVVVIAFILCMFVVLLWLWGLLLCGL